jgi:hypothetical protein
MAATFHYLPLYSYLNESPRSPEKIFDNIVRLANSEGYFNLPSGYACLDYDGISSLNYLLENALSVSERKDRIPICLTIATALRTNLLSAQNEDGGFSEAGTSNGVFIDTRNLIRFTTRVRCFWSTAWNANFILKSWLIPNRIIHSNSILACRARINESNSFATWFRFMTIACCEDLIRKYGAPIKEEARRKPLPLPGLGYF